MSFPRVKVCGITRVEDGRLAVSLGASHLGFIFFDKSPRAIGLEDYEVLSRSLPDSFRVAVDVRPSMEAVSRQMAAGFDFLQVHFDELHDTDYLNELSDLVGRERLWLAPKLPPGELFPESLFQYADTCLIDTYHKDEYGGSGKTGDWSAFRQLQLDYPENNWILAGGLNPGNILEALAQAQPPMVDANSGLEDSPGLKSPQKLEAFFKKLKA